MMSRSALVRSMANPILTREDVPAGRVALTDVSAVFNPGALRHADRVHLLLRVQNRGRETWLVPAWSTDGIRFTVDAEPAHVRGLERAGGTIHHLYDPRIACVDGEILVCVALDTDDGCHLGVLRTGDLRDFELVGVTRDRESRNGVLFPERLGDEYLRLERPNTIERAGEPATGDRIVLATSTDLIDWSPRATVLEGRPRFWDERIGSGPPPVKTPEGWLHLYHGVATHFGSSHVYQVGAILLDLQDPSRVLARTRYNLLEPREPYELTGQVPNVVFPSGWVVDLDDEGFARPDRKVFVYYGAADTCVGLATATVGDLLAACREGS